MAWQYPSNFSNGTAVDGLSNLFKYMDYVVNGWFAEAVVLIIFVIAFALFSLTSTRKALLASSFIAFIFSVYFIRLGLINPIITFALIVIMIVGAVGAKEETSY